MPPGRGGSVLRVLLILASELCIQGNLPDQGQDNPGLNLLLLQEHHLIDSTCEGNVCLRRQRLRLSSVGRGKYLSLDI